VTRPDSVDVGVLTARPAEMLAFYTEVVGLVHVASVETALGPMEVLASGSGRVKLVTSDDATGTASRHYLTFETGDLDASWQRALRGGAPPVAEPAPIRGGAGVVAMVRDPDGSLVEFIQRRASPHP